MNEMISVNINTIVILVFIIISYTLSCYISKIVNWFLTPKHLVVALFIIVSFMIFLVFNIFSVETVLIAPYMIALSALLASAMAVLNIKNNNQQNIIDKSDKVVALTHSGIAKIEFFTEKSELLKLMLTGKSKISLELLKEYEILIRTILEFLNREDLYNFTSDKILYELHNDIILFLPILKKEIQSVDKNQLDGKYITLFKNIKSYEKFIDKLDEFAILLEKIEVTETKEHRKLYQEQNKC